MENKKSKHWDTPRTALVLMLEKMIELEKSNPNDQDFGKKARKYIKEIIQ